MTKRGVLILALAGAVAGSGCATTGQTSGPARSQDMITLEELSTVRVSTLYDAIQRLRPRWLTVRSQQSFGAPTQVVVYQNQSQLGSFEALRSLGLDAVEWIQYLDGPTASASLPGLGSQQVAGAIVIHTTERRR